jgi:DNA-binding transcriptional LysR family regulator
MDLNEILVFTRVVQAGSFTTAAAELGMPKSSVSRKVSDLEDRLKTRLLQRTTRKLSLTDVGRTYFDYCVRIVSEIESAERAVSSLQDVPRGLLRVTTLINATFLGPIVSDYMQRYPEVQVELFSTGRRVDLVEERYDLGIRAGALPDSSLIARSLGSVSWFFVATPGYLKKHGRPRSPEDLKTHDCVFFGSGTSTMTVRLFQGDDEPLQLSVPARLMVSDNDILLAATRAGVGIGLLPAFLCLSDMRTRQLEQVLREWTVPVTPVHVVYPGARHISPKVKSFVDFLQSRMTPPPWELGPGVK